ncbi:Chaoptin [Temnothorax longispinosus]|uniref:Chaoptin n=1 Tax=Temnothorax longispinosus TaxID=300112 RepID=A0A4S2KV17_9HYME|nr:Chaoptin [Temnothorax longispinosus]
MQIEESSFEGLTKLKWLSLQDNNILLVPASALTQLPSLAHLHVQFNRIAALSSELIRATSTNLMTLGLTRNLVREIPPRLFYNFENLINIELSGNMLSIISQNMFAGLEDTLQNLDISYNRLTDIIELPLRNLVSLNLAGNQLKRISPDTFKYLHKLRYLNLSNNPLYGGFPPIFPSSLINLDISYTELKILPSVLLLNLESLERISLASNQLQEIDEGTFQYLYNLTTIDLSYNAIEHIDNNAFVGLINLYSLNLRDNRLTSFIGEHFNTGTGLEILDLSDNRINQLSQTAFAIHPRLRQLNLSGNRFVQFSSDYVKSLQFLEWLDLSRNMLLHVDELAFYNSTQLQLLDLSGNVLETLNERTMEGLLRLESLDLRNNRLALLPETIFDSSRVHAVERIDLSGNRFNEIPIRALQRQFVSLFSLKLAHNRVLEVFTQDIINNVKELDLSENPLSENAIRGILGEAKVLRSLNLANTSIKTIPRLETPFLRHLNLSGNTITDINPVMFERTTMLESLDVSKNRLTDFTNLIRTFKNLPVLQSLDISNNELKNINESNFDGLAMLHSLKMANLLNCTRIEKNAFRSLTKLRLLHAYNYPKLGYFDVQGILKHMTNLEILDIEIKDSSVGNEQLSVRIHPYLRDLTLRGERLRNILSSSLVGVRGPRLLLSLKDTSVDSIPTALFFPVPRSTKIELNVSGSKFTNLPPQLLNALDERRASVRISGLDNNPINCSCEVRHLWNWLKSLDNKAPTVICAKPDYLMGTLLSNLTEEYFLCNRTSTLSNISNTDDTLIIGIVGSVVAFIAIIIITICICRLRWSNQMQEARIAAMAASSIHEASMIRPASAYSGKINPHDLYVSSYNGSTLERGGNTNPSATPVQMMPYVQPIHMMHAMSSLSPSSQQIYGYYDNPSLPVYSRRSTTSEITLSVIGTSAEINFLLKLMDWLEATKKELHDNEAITITIYFRPSGHNWHCCHISTAAGSSRTSVSVGPLSIATAAGSSSITAAADPSNNAAAAGLLIQHEEEGARNFSKNVLQSFYTAQILYDVLTLFEELSVETAQNRKYAQWKAVYLNNCFTNGETSVPRPMKEADDDSTSINASNDNDDELESSVNPESPKDNTLLDLPTTRTQWFESEDDKYGAKLTQSSKNDQMGKQCIGLCSYFCNESSESSASFNYWSGIHIDKMDRKYVQQL